ncbi:MAG: hypothetical protein Ct9H300mP13_1000 [Gammaproteobacteria bacterium]|nr:MAG: hypothetical protein Ct9H300mP13_1000 [Gammaproteobacteria bacterium]
MFALLKHEKTCLTTRYNMNNAYYETVDHLEKLGSIRTIFRDGSVDTYAIQSVRNKGLPMLIKPVMKMAGGVTDKARDWQVLSICPVGQL